MSRRPYAADTSVSVEKSEAEIRSILRRYGAEGFAMGEANGQAQVMFQVADRRIVMRLTLPRRDDERFTHARVNGSDTRYRRSSDQAILKAWEQACRQKWRALALCIKAKLESVESGIETFDQAFLAHVMLPSGETVGEHMARPENLQAALNGRKMPPLLGGPPQ
jgi:hypothetical protein